MAEFESNNDDNIKNIALFTENNNMLRKILDSVDSKDSLLKSVSAEDNITKSLNHIDKRLLGSLKNKSNVLLEDILRTNIDSLKLTNFISDRMIDVRNYIMKANRNLDNKDDENTTNNIDNISEILAEQLGVLISIDKTNKKVFDAQLDILYKSGSGRKGNKELTDDEQELNDLKNQAKKLQYLNDIEYEKQREKLAKASSSESFFSPNKLQNLLTGVAPVLAAGLSSILTNPLTWTAGAVVLAGVMVKKLADTVIEGREDLNNIKSDIDKNLKGTPYASAAKKSETIMDKASIGIFGAGTIENKLFVKTLNESTENLKSLNKQLEIIKQKQKAGLALTDKEQKTLKSENSVRQIYQKNFLEASLNLQKAGVELTPFEKGYAQAKGYPNLSKDINLYNTITDKFGKSIYDSFDDANFQKSLTGAISSGITEEQFLKIYKGAREQQIAGTGIGLKKTGDITEDLKMFAQIVKSVEELAKKTNLTKSENLKIRGDVKNFIANIGSGEQLTKIAEKTANVELSDIIYQETAEPINNEPVNKRATGGEIPLKGTTIVGENNPEFIKNNKVISPIGKSNQTNKTTLEKTIKDSVNDNIKQFSKSITDGNNNINKNIVLTNNLLENLINIMSSKENNINNNVLNNIQTTSNQPQQLPMQRHNNPYRDSNRLKNIE